MIIPLLFGLLALIAPTIGQNTGEINNLANKPINDHSEFYLNLFLIF
jgi:hypothetical protein